MNPRSIYNKINEFKTLIEQEELEVVFLSESWEREELPLNEIFNDPSFEIVSNVYQRNNSGGRPAIVIKKDRYHILNATNTIVQIPWGVEAVWAVLTPHSVSQSSLVQKIVCCSVYSKPDSKKKTLLIDHISETFSQLKTKYGRGTHFIIAGDFNDLKVDKILSLSPNFAQIVRDWTRLNPPAILDPIITTLSNLYQEPVCTEPLEADCDKIGAPSDHRIVICKPINTVENKCSRSTKTITFRPITERGLSGMKEWLVDFDWKEVFKAETGHEKADVFQKIILDKVNFFFPRKTRKVSSDDKPWFSSKLKSLDRKRKRTYRKEKKSEKWRKHDLEFKIEMKEAKRNFYKKEVAHLKLQKPGNWYKCLRRITSLDQHRDEDLHVEEISHLSKQQQAEEIASKFASIPNEYEALETKNIEIPPFKESEIPEFHPAQVWFALTKLETNKSTVDGDIPVKILKTFAAYFSEPLTHIFNTCIRRGEYPDIYKYEICTPIPKVFPTQKLSQLRNISGLFTFDKIFEKLLAELMISDMKEKLDKSQFGNQKNMSIQHYLVLMLQKIHSSLDKKSKGESTAILATFIDWDNAFPRQCPELGVKSFIENGIRPALIPILVNYFQGRHMSVKWHGYRSEPKHIKGGGAQGATFGSIGYLSQSNKNADCVPVDSRFKFVDDLSTIELINLLTIGLASFNIRNQVPNDIISENTFIPPESLQSQKWLNSINKWTEEHKMVINERKTKAMLFNFSNDNQFSTRLKLKDENIEFISSTRLLGTIIQNDLKWDLNTRNLVKKANARMELLRCVASFSPPKDDLRIIYTLFIRSILEQSAVVWHSSLTQENIEDLERVQKTAVKIILGSNYKGYEEGLRQLGLETLDKRREQLCLNFAKKCVKNERLQHMFPLKTKSHSMKTRKPEKFKVYKANNERYKNSAIIYMQNLLNTNQR